MRTAGHCLLIGHATKVFFVPEVYKVKEVGNYDKELFTQQIKRVTHKADENITVYLKKDKKPIKVHLDEYQKTIGDVDKEYVDYIELDVLTFNLDEDITFSELQKAKKSDNFSSQLLGILKEYKLLKNKQFINLDNKPPEGNYRYYCIGWDVNMTRLNLVVSTIYDKLKRKEAYENQLFSHDQNLVKNNAEEIRMTNYEFQLDIPVISGMSGAPVLKCGFREIKQFTKLPTKLYRSKSYGSLSTKLTLTRKNEHKVKEIFPDNVIKEEKTDEFILSCKYVGVISHASDTGYMINYAVRGDVKKNTYQKTVVHHVEDF